jgi:hypothetical protein
MPSTTHRVRNISNALAITPERHTCTVLKKLEKLPGSVVAEFNWM